MDQLPQTLSVVNMNKMEVDLGLILAVASSDMLNFSHRKSRVISPFFPHSKAIVDPAGNCSIFDISESILELVDKAKCLLSDIWSNL